MNTEAQRQYADIEVVLSWSSEHARHEERHYYQGINLWRDYFPGMLGERLLQSEDGERIEETFAAGELVEPATRSLSLIHISEPTRQESRSRMPSSA